MDPILFVFAVMAATAASQAALEWWRGRPWAAALLAVLAAVAATPLTVGLPDLVIVAGLLVLAGIVGWLVWPRPHRDDPTSDEHSNPNPGASRADRGRRGGRS